MNYGHLEMYVFPLEVQQKLNLAEIKNSRGHQHVSISLGNIKNSKSSRSPSKSGTPTKLTVTVVFE